MYDELVKQLREAGEKSMCGECGLNLHTGATKKGVLFAEAADAIEELQQIAAHYEEAAKDYFKDVCYYLERVPKWIPVTERLPEHDMNVLICYEWTGRSGTVYTEVGIASIEELERDPTEMFRPLYWMPLPEPPKGKVFQLPPIEFAEEGE